MEEVSIVTTVLKTEVITVVVTVVLLGIVAVVVVVDSNLILTCGSTY